MQPQVSQDLLDRGPLQDGRDDLQACLEADDHERLLMAETSLILLSRRITETDFCWATEAISGRVQSSLPRLHDSFSGIRGAFGSATTSAWPAFRRYRAARLYFTAKQ
jgi:hypothetical protein